TPVLAFNRGAAREVVEPGVTGYVVESVGEAICKIGSVLALDRGQVRRRFEERFTSTRMTRDYLNLYASLLDRHAAGARRRVAAPPRVAKAAEGPAVGGRLGDAIPAVAAAEEPRAGS